MSLLVVVVMVDDEKERVCRDKENKTIDHNKTKFLVFFPNTSFPNKFHTQTLSLFLFLQHFFLLLFLFLFFFLLLLSFLFSKLFEPLLHSLLPFFFSRSSSPKKRNWSKTIPHKERREKREREEKREERKGKEKRKEKREKRREREKRKCLSFQKKDCRKGSSPFSLFFLSFFPFSLFLFFFLPFFSFSFPTRVF